MFESSSILFDIVQCESDRPVGANSSFRPQFVDVFELILPDIRFRCATRLTSSSYH
jgi:hypothetical protein